MRTKNALFLILLVCVPLSSLALEGDVYDFHWLDPDKEIYVLQNRKFRKKGKLHFALGGGITTSGPFVDTTVFQGRVGYFVREELGFEWLYSKNNGKENDTAKSVRNYGRSDGSGSVPFRRILTDYMGGMLLWSPFYNKINTFNSIIYSDWMVGLGYAKLEEKNNREELLKAEEEEVIEGHGGILWNLGNQIYLSEHLSVRIDLTTILYKAKEVRNNKKIWYSNWDIVLSLGHRF